MKKDKLVLACLNTGYGLDLGKMGLLGGSVGTILANILPDTRKLRERFTNEKIPKALKELITKTRVDIVGLVEVFGEDQFEKMTDLFENYGYHCTRCVKAFKRDGSPFGTFIATKEPHKPLEISGVNGSKMPATASGSMAVNLPESNIDVVLSHLPRVPRNKMEAALGIFRRSEAYYEGESTYFWQRDLDDLRTNLRGTQYRIFMKELKAILDFMKARLEEVDDIFWLGDFNERQSVLEQRVAECISVPLHLQPISCPKQITWHTKASKFKFKRMRKRFLDRIDRVLSVGDGWEAAGSSYPRGRLDVGSDHYLIWCTAQRKRSR